MAGRVRNIDWSPNSSRTFAQARMHIAGVRHDPGAAATVTVVGSMLRFGEHIMVYRKGELSPAAVDRGWPFQVALPASPTHR